MNSNNNYYSFMYFLTHAEKFKKNFNSLWFKSE